MARSAFSLLLDLRRPVFCLGENEYFGFRKEEKKWETENEGLHSSLSILLPVLEKDTLSCMVSEDNMEQWDFFWDVFFLEKK